jgi:hypothetical protein
MFEDRCVALKFELNGLQFRPHNDHTLPEGEHLYPEMIVPIGIQKKLPTDKTALKYM